MSCTSNSNHTTASTSADMETKVKVELVERARDKNASVFDSDHVSTCIDTMDLVELAAHVQNADEFVRARAIGRLEIIAEQMRQLQQQARQVLKEAHANDRLHHAACNFKKIPGNVYSLYQKPSGQKFWSMISPQEWGYETPNKFLGAYRLEADRSWTSSDKFDERKREIDLMDQWCRMGIGQTVLIFDNGAGSIKAATSAANAPRIISNSIVKTKTERKRVYIGDQLAECQDKSSLFFLLPFQCGFLINWDVEHQIWDYAFEKECLNVDCKDTCIIFTEPYANFSFIRDSMDEVIFEDYGFASALRTKAGSLSAFGYLETNAAEHCCLVVDSGYSFTHIAPYSNGKLLQQGVIRISIGGKALTNQLKEWISYRHLQVMEETYVMNQCKEDACFVSSDFDRDMHIACERKSNSIARHYVLPDFLTLQRGYVMDVNEPKNEDVQTLKLNAERFCVPELLFRPSDVAINEMGIPEAIAYSVLEKCPEALRGRLLRNVLLVGGNTLFNGYAQRIREELRSLVPDVYDVRVVAAKNPISNAWEGGKLMAEKGAVGQRVVTRAQYDEQGQWRVSRHAFNDN